MTAQAPTREQIASVTTEHIAAELQIATTGINGGDVLRELPGADSMKMLRVVSKLERRWNVEFEDEDIFAVKTVDELVALVEKSVAAL